MFDPTELTAPGPTGAVAQASTCVRRRTHRLNPFAPSDESGQTTAEYALLTGP